MSDEDGGVRSSLRKGGEDAEDPWPDEPAEFDPRSLGPGGLTPEGGEDDGEEAEVDRETIRAFYGAVVLANVGLFGVAVGPMLWYFRGHALLGGGMFVVGVVALTRVYRVKQEYQESRGERGDELRGDGADVSEPEDGDAGDDR